MCTIVCAGAAEAPLKTVADIPLSGGTGRFDYQSIDPETHRLFISHMGAGTVHVVDLAARKEIANLSGFPGATGIAAVPTLHRVFVSVTGGLWSRAFGGGRLAAIDETSLKTVWNVPAGKFPDGIAYVPELNRVFVSDERGEQELVFDAHDGRPVAVQPLGGEAGMTVYDPSAKRILVNVQTKNEIAVIDPAGPHIERRIALPAECDNNHGLLLTAAHVIVACDGNAKLVVLDHATMKPARVFDVGKEPDVLALDSQRLYVASESGVVSVFDMANLRKLGEGFAGPNAHSIAVDPATGLLYLPLSQGRPVLRIMEFAPR
jgi:DNA-binding beta-propeller fold protein YncE